MFENNAPSLSDIAAVTNNDGFGGNNGWWVLILLFAMFGGWGNRGGYGAGGAVQENYVLTSDFANIERKLDSVSNGLSSLGYEHLNQINGVNTNIFNAQTAVSAQITALGAQSASQACEIKRAIIDSERRIIDNDNANYRALNDRLTAMEMAAKDKEIADLRDQLAKASQKDQTSTILAAVKSQLGGCCNTGCAGYNA